MMSLLLNRTGLKWAFGALARQAVAAIQREATQNLEDTEDKQRDSAWPGYLRLRSEFPRFSRHSIWRLCGLLGDTDRAGKVLDFCIERHVDVEVMLDLLKTVLPTYSLGFARDDHEHTIKHAEHVATYTGEGHG